MHVDLYLLRHSGTKLRRSELGTPTRGYLRIGTWVLANAIGRRRIRQADLSAHDHPACAPIASLFGAVIVRLDDKGLVLSGWSDIDETERQGWWCLPVR